MTISDTEDSGRTPGSAREAGSAVYEGLLDVVLTGLAIIIPVIITLYLLSIAIDFILKALTPFITLLQYFGLIDAFEHTGVIYFLSELGLYSAIFDFLAELIALGVLSAIILVVGFIGHNRYGEQIINYIDLAIASIPGIGTVYKSFRRMGDVMLDSEAENFQDIKLVRCLDEQMYVIGFETSGAPTTVETATGHEEMITMFIPMAPNPVTGGFLTYVPREDVFDVDMTIEDGIRSILTSGVATGQDADTISRPTLDDIESIARVDKLEDALSINREVDSEETRDVGPSTGP